MKKENQTIVIVGGGLAGCFLAILLGKRGYKVKLYERLSKNDISDTNASRSYNITFRTYGIEMLKKAGVWDTLQPHLLPLKGAYTQLSKNSKPILSLIEDNTLEYLSVSRNDLLQVLFTKISSDRSISVNFDTALLSVDRYKKTIIVENIKSGKISQVPCDVVIGADGANSLVRQFIQQGQHTHHSQEYSPGGYKQFALSNEEVKKLNLRCDIAYTWSAEKKFILAFPNLDGSLSALLIYPENKFAFKSLATEESITKLITNEFPFLLPIQDSITKQLLENPVGSFVTIHTEPWYYKDFMTLVGDAAHGFYPFFGQGTTAAFGDCMALIELIDLYGDDWNKIFPLYQKKRKIHMDTLGELSKEGLLRYMRNKRADFESIYNKLEDIGHALLPEHIQPPVFQQVTDNPGKTADYVEKHTKQRKLARKLGISFGVIALTAMVAVFEKFERGSKSS
jgi:kynurenine 3-monooxygenase